MAEGEVVVEQSTILSEEEVTATLEGTQHEEVATLPSDEGEFVLPEKMQGKSAEEIAKMYVELEKFKSKQEEPPTEKEPKKEEEPPKEPTPVEKEAYDRYAQSFEKNGELSEAEYTELAEAGYTKEQVDAEINRVKEQKEFQKYKQERALNEVLEPLGGGTEKFKEVGMWANESKTPEELKAFNEALASSSKIAQQALLKTLYAEYESANKEETILHTNSPQVQPSKGYATETDFFKDIGNPAYKNDKSYVAAVEAKLAKTDRSKWSF